MAEQKKLIVSHAPFWHDGSSIHERSYHIMGAALLPALAGFVLYGMPAVGVMSLSISFAIFWEFAFTAVTKRPLTIADGNAALIGMLFGMLLPAATPWWAVVTGTFIAVIIGKQIFGGIGSNAFNPAVLAVAILMVAWKERFNFDAAYVNYSFGFAAQYPLGVLKHFGVPATRIFHLGDLFFGRQTGGLGTGCGAALVAAGAYLIYRGFIRWEISLSFLAGIFLTAQIFNLADPVRFGGPFFHLLTGYTLFAAFFLLTEDSSSPVNLIPMLIYGFCGGVLTILIRNIGAHIDGSLYAVLAMNMVNPLLDKIRPKAIGKVL